MCCSWVVFIFSFFIISSISHLSDVWCFAVFILLLKEFPPRGQKKLYCIVLCGEQGNVRPAVFLFATKTFSRHFWFVFMSFVHFWCLLVFPSGRIDSKKSLRLSWFSSPATTFCAVCRQGQKKTEWYFYSAYFCVLLANLFLLSSAVVHYRGRKNSVPS